MASQYITVKKYAGVCYVESKRHKFRGKPDRIFWVRFKDRNGKLKYEKCGRASEGWTPEAAQKKRFNILEQDRAGKYKPKDQRKKQSITLNTLFDKHYYPWAKLNKKRPNDDESRYRNWLRDSLGPKPLNEIDRKDLESLMQTMTEAGKAKATIRQVIALTRYLFNQAAEWNLYKGENPCSKIKIKVDNARQRFLSKDEANLLLTELRKKSNQTAQIAGLSLYTGMRLGEIFNLKWSDIDQEHNLIAVLDAKNDESRKVFITEPVKAVINELLTGKPNDYLFTNTKGEKLTQLSRSFSRTIENLKFNEGIEDNRQRISFHNLRHTFASWAVMNGVPLYHLAKALGHKTTAMTERYAHLAPDSQKMAFKAVAGYKE
jgi:integrase